ncbi:MAG: folylpolyglutamate synthase/dihydrofolate synthase family protein [Candidatus Omnitrophota bacterium]
MRSYKGTLEFLESFVNYEKTGFDVFKKAVSLDNLRGTLKDLGSPEGSFRSLHVAGTKGKGSICTFASSILKETGHKTGLFTSPHLARPNERIKINGESITPEDLTNTVDYLKDAIGPINIRKLTFFEIYTLMAIVYFNTKGVDFAVFETGIGGRLDATNVIDAEVSAISPISYDHTQVLGNTIGKIAAEKAAIIKNKSCCISSPQEEEALRVIIDRCAETSSTMFLVGKDINYKIKSSDESGNSFNLYTSYAVYDNCNTRLVGEFQVANSAAAVGMCEEILKNVKYSQIAFKRGIQNAFIEARLEILSRSPLIVIDGAQNTASAAVLRTSVRKIFKYDRLILILGLCQDKDIAGVCGELAPCSDEIILTRSSAKRAASPHLIRGYVMDRQVQITDDVKEALGRALLLAGKGDMILTAGSFFVAGEVRQLILGKT